MNIVFFIVLNISEKRRNVCLWKYVGFVFGVSFSVSL